MADSLIGRLRAIQERIPVEQSPTIYDALLCNLIDLLPDIIAALEFQRGRRGELLTENPDHGEGW